MTVTKKANAKINLSLDLTSVLPNGYHAISTVMQSVSLCDTVTITDGDTGIRLECDAADMPTDERNTAFTAAKYYYEAIGASPAVRIKIEKRIPVQAGLGGGSADAAAVLDILNEMHGYALTEERLLAIALRIGADVPFALLGGTRYCMNIGEITARLPHVKAHVVIAKPATGVSTGEAYRRFDGGALLTHPDNDRLLYYFAESDHKNALIYAKNVFEQLVDLPQGEAIKRVLTENGAFFASLSGSGSAYYGLFDTAEAAERAKEAVKTIVPWAVCCETALKGVAAE